MEDRGFYHEQVICSITTVYQFETCSSLAINVLIYVSPEKKYLKKLSAGLSKRFAVALNRSEVTYI